MKFLFGFKPMFLMDENTGDQGGGAGGSSEADKDKGQGSGNQGQSGDGNKGGSGNSLDSLPDWAKKEIADLRSENAKHRTSNKSLNDRLTKLEGNIKKVFGGEDENETPEEKLSKFEQANQALEIKNALTQMAYESGIPTDQYEYFEFLMGKELSKLGEDEEMSEDKISEIIQKCSAGKSSANSSVGNGQSTGTKPKNTGEVTLEQFKKMGITEKSRLYQSNRELYTKLFNEQNGK